MVAGVRPQYPSQWAAITAVAGMLGIGTTETLRTWIRRSDIDTGQRPGVTTQMAEENKALRKEIAELRRANEILKAAAIFFGAPSCAPRGAGWIGRWWETVSFGPSQRPDEASGQPIARNDGDPWQAAPRRRAVLLLPDGAGSSSEVRRVQRERTSVRRSVIPKPAPTWRIWAGLQCTTPSTAGLTPKPFSSNGGEAMVKACGVIVAMLPE